MITTQEKENIRSGFQNIQTSINRLLFMLNEYKSKKNEITLLLNTRFALKDTNHLLQQFFERESDLTALEESFSTIPEIDDSISDQYKTFLQAEITQFNPQSLYLLEEHTQLRIHDFLGKQKSTQLFISPNDNTVISWIKDVPNQYTSYIDTLLNLQCKLHIFNQIKTIDGSIVMIGANGSGKSTFARQLNGKLANNIVILSAQHFLHYNKRNTISASGNEIQKVHNFQLNSKLGSDGNFQQLITSDMNDLVDALMAQHTDCALELYDNGKHNSSFLNRNN